MVTRALGALRNYHPGLIGLFYLVLLVFGVFEHHIILKKAPTFLQIALFGLFVLFFTWRLALMALSAAASIDSFYKVEFSFLVYVLVLIVLQATGGWQSPIFAIFYLLVGLMVSFIGFRDSLVLTGISLGALLLNAWKQGLVFSLWDRELSAFGFSLVFILTIGLYTNVARKRALRAQHTLYRLASEAKEIADRRINGIDLLRGDNIDREDVSAVLHIDRILGDMTEIAKRALSAHTCMIAFLDENHKSLILRAVSSDEKPSDELIGYDLSDTVLMEVVKLQENLIIENIGRSWGRPGYRPWGTPAKALLAVPLVEDNRIVGVIAADHLHPYHFGDEEEHFLSMMAQRITEAVQRERQYRHISAEKTEIAGFYDMIKNLGSSIDLQTVSNVILQSGKAIAPYDYGVLVKVEPGSGEGIIQAVSGLSGEKWLGRQFSLPDSLLGWVVGSKTYLHYPRLRERMGKVERRRPVFSPKLPLKNPESVLCLPLIRRNFVTGMLVFAMRKPDAFTAHEIKFFEVLAVQAAVSLENALVHAKMEELATTDGLTGCHNHRYFQEWLEHELVRARRMPIQISLLLADIDNFKKVNDTYGHPVGDLVLQTISRVLRSSVRQNDLAARYGGEEFAVVLLNTDAKGAERFANRLKEKINQTNTSYPGGKIQVTVSMGISTFPNDGEEKKILIELADQALYAAKQAGRNRVIHIGELSLQQR